MFLISHRGNLNGPSPEQENTPVQIDAAIEQGIFCEVDVWRINNKFYLSHDYPDTRRNNIHFTFFESRASDLVIHCKNIEALQYFHEDISNHYNYFWHQEDDYTLTSWGWIWAYPEKKLSHFSENIAIAVMPERCVTPLTKEELNNFAGICTDQVAYYYDKISTV